MTAATTARVLALLFFLAVPAAAHIGSPNVFYEGTAGPYPVRVIVKTPGVVPGLAQITVRAEDPGIRRVTVRPVHWRANLEGAPPADEAKPVRGDETSYDAELWLMTSGSYSVYVEVEGERGSGTAIVPVQSEATERLGMAPWLGAVLVLLGGLLVAGLVRLAGAAVESVVTPGEEPGAAHGRRTRVAMVAALLIVSLVLYGGKSWWDAVDAEYVSGLWRTYDFSASIRLENGWRVVELELDDERWQRASPIAPDHGKLMHMFLIREPELDAFAHVHPVKVGGFEFAVTVPPLPAGSYRIYADVTHESGSVQTLTDIVELPEPDPSAGEPPQGLEPDPDDSWAVTTRPGDGKRHAFDDGSVMAWELAGPTRAGEETTLTFSFHGPDGEPGALEPYMGMLSHAAVRRDDGSVFIHLHPTGTISMAAQELFARRGAASEEGTAAMDHSQHGMGQHGMDHGRVSTVTMPYEFPREGKYRLWVQVKSAGRVYTGFFDADVRPREG